MKKNQKLRTCWDISLGIYSAFTIISTILLLISLAFNDLPNINSLISERKITSINNFIRLIVILMAIGNVLYIVVLFKLKKLITLFMNNDFFTSASIKLLKEIGAYLSISTMLIYIPCSFYNSIISFESTNGVFAQSLGKTAFFIFALLGIFFLILSSIFEEAKAIKDENLLTI